MYEINSTRAYRFCNMAEAVTTDDRNTVEDELEIERHAIGCDYCSKPSPTKNCARCMSYYYCDRNCQVANWKNHKEHCSFLKSKFDKYVEK